MQNVMAHANTPLYELFKDAKLLHYPKQHIVIHADDTPAGMYFLEKGYMKVTVLNVDGKDITINMVKPGSCFPLIWGLTGAPNAYYYHAMTAVDVRRVDRQIFSQYLMDRTGTFKLLTETMLLNTNDLVIGMERMMSTNAFKRVIMALLILIARIGEKQNRAWVMNIPISHQEIANMTCVSRETVSAVLKRLQNDRYIEYNNHLISVPSRTRLELYLRSSKVPIFLP
jgi:CRP/FNR family transcriptional regulator